MAYTPNSHVLPFGNTAGPVNAYTIAIPGATLTDAYTFEARINIDNTGPATVNVNGLGVKSIVDSDLNPLTAGMLNADSIYLFAYNLTQTKYQLLGLAKTLPLPIILTFKTTITNAAFKTINTIPIQLLPAPGVNKYYAVDNENIGMVKAVQVGANNFNAAGNVVYTYDSSTNNNVIANYSQIDAGGLNSLLLSYFKSQVQGSGFQNPNPYGATSNYINRPVILYNDFGNSTGVVTSGGDVTITFNYSILDLS